MAFTVVAIAAGSTAAGASYVEARRAVLDQAQQNILNDLRGRLDALAVRLSYPIDERSLAALSADGVTGDPFCAIYQSLQMPQGCAEPSDTAIAMPAFIVPAGLRQTVRDRHRMAWQRVVDHTIPYLISGVPVNGPDGLSSGLEVYVRTDLSPVEARVDALAWSATRTLLLAVAGAGLVALFAARRVLRPVRNLRQAAHALAAGDLASRVPVQGADELAELATSFNEMAATLQQSVAELRRMEGRARRFAADVSHELRTPLTTMIAVSDTLDQDAEHLPGDTGTAARLISAETRRLGALVEDLIEISRLDAGTAALRVDEVDLAAAVRTTLSRRAWTDQVDTVLPAGVTVRVDPRRLDVIVANLVANALRHGAPPVTVTAEMVRDADRTETFTVTVNDHGNGVPNGALAHLFDRFYKADLARTRSEGSGLGLAIAMENAKLHGGTIEVRNVPGGGAQFRLRLPVHV